MCSEHSHQTKKKNNNNVLPDEKYVYCGRGKVNAKRPGNKQFARIIQSNLKDYINAETKMAKVVVVTSVVDFLRRSGMKFITFDVSTNSYVELSSKRIHTKVSHAIRDQIKQNEKDNNFATKLEGRRQKVATNILSTDSSDKPVARNTVSSKNLVGGNSRTKKRTAPPGQTNMSAERSDGKDFNTWWAQQKNARFEKQMRSASPIPKNRPSPPVRKSIFEDEGILDVSRTIFDFGAKIDETSVRATRRDDDWNFVIQQLLEKEDVIATPPPISPFFEMEIPMLESIQSQIPISRRETASNSSPALALRSPSPNVDERLCPLPVDSDAEFAYEDVWRLSAILDGVHDEALLFPTAKQEDRSIQGYGDIMF